MRPFSFFVVGMINGRLTGAHPRPPVVSTMLTAIEQAVDDEIERTEERAQQHRNEIERRKAIEEQLNIRSF